MSERENDGADAQGQGQAERPESARPVVGQMVRKTSRFSREVVATMIALASTAFGVVAALAWNAAITAWFNDAFGTEVQAQNIATANVSALFIYAVVATVVGVVVIVFLGRLAARLNAEPVEFRYPVPPRQ